MTKSSDKAYYLRREQDARRQASRSTDEAIEALHIQMAERYAVLASEARESIAPVNNVSDQILSEHRKAG